MLITKKEIIEKIDAIPPLPEVVRKTIEYLQAEQLQKAADEADKDIVLKNKILKIVNSAYFGFSREVTQTRQMFSVMGVEMAKSVVLSYMVELLKPKEWKLFEGLDFDAFQSFFLAKTKEAIILETSEEVYKKYANLAAIIPATICLVDDLLGDKRTQVELLIESSGLNYGEILERFTGFSLFSLASFVAKKWELEKNIVELLEFVECKNCDLKDEEQKTIAATLHLELFFCVSKPQFFVLNSFVNFNPEVIQIAKKNYERKINEE